MLNIKNMLIKLRAKEDLSQVELAKIFRVSFMTLNSWENERTVPSAKHIQQIINLCEEKNIQIEEKKK